MSFSLIEIGYLPKEGDIRNGTHVYTKCKLWGHEFFYWKKIKKK